MAFDPCLTSTVSDAPRRKESTAHRGMNNGQHHESVTQSVVEYVRASPRRQCRVVLGFSATICPGMS